KTLSRSPPILVVLRESLTALPQLIDQLEGGQPPALDVVAFATRAHALAAGKNPPAAPAPEVAPEPAAVSEPAPEPLPDVAGTPEVPDASVAADEPPDTGSDTDPTLREIFSRETTGHIATIRSWLAREAALPA